MGQQATKVILHCGLPKTGTTALQHALSGARNDLLREGILYPDAVGDNAHHALLSLWIDDVPGILFERFGGKVEGVRSAAQGIVEATANRERATHPASIVLSSEFFPRAFSGEGLAAMKTMFAEFSWEPVFCIYVRRPSAHYLSLLQQHVKLHSTMLQPSALRVRERLEAVQEYFPGKVVVRAFDAALLEGGDIVRDFAVRVLGVDSASLSHPSGRSNESVSAEAMSIIKAFRLEIAGDADGKTHRGAGQLLNVLRHLDVSIPGQRKPRLRPDVSAAIDAASIELLWLQNTWGIAFPDMDYSAIGQKSPEHLPMVHAIKDVCEVDSDRHDRLLLGAVQRGIEAELTLSQLERVLPVGPLLNLKQKLKRATRRT